MAKNANLRVAVPKDSVRDVEVVFLHEIENKDDYYKEAVINARSPENEADSFERDFIEELNKSSDLVDQGHPAHGLGFCARAHGERFPETILHY